MIFARIGTATAWILFIYGCVTAAMGIYFAASGLGHEAAQEYFNTATTGELINGSFRDAGIGLALGIASEVVLKLNSIKQALAQLKDLDIKGTRDAVLDVIRAKSSG